MTDEDATHLAHRIGTQDCELQRLNARVKWLESALNDQMVAVVVGVFAVIVGLVVLALDVNNRISHLKDALAEAITHR